MVDVAISLDRLGRTITALSRNGRMPLPHLAEAVPPCKSDPCPVYKPLQRAAYVVEINAGQARREQATIGSTLSFQLPR